MINKVPKEELDALFYEIYDRDLESFKNTEKSSTNSKEGYNFYGLKFKSYIKFNFTKHLPVPFNIVDYSISLSDSIQTKRAEIGFDLENKYRIFIFVDEDFYQMLSQVLKEDIALSEDENFSSNILLNILENIGTDIISEMGVSFSVLKFPYIQFYTDSFAVFEFKCNVMDSNLSLYILAEKTLLDSGLIQKVIYSKPTSKELSNIYSLIKRLRYDIELTSQKLKVEDLKPHSLVKLSNIKFKRTIKPS